MSFFYSIYIRYLHRYQVKSFSVLNSLLSDVTAYLFICYGNWIPDCRSLAAGRAGVGYTEGNALTKLSESGVLSPLGGKKGQLPRVSLKDLPVALSFKLHHTVMIMHIVRETLNCPDQRNGQWWTWMVSWRCRISRWLPDTFTMQMTVQLTVIHDIST